MKSLKPVLLHLLAVVVSLGVALVLWRVLGIDSPIVLGIFSAVAVAIEKLLREHPSIPVGDYVNDN